VRLQPLGHLSALRCGAYINVSGKYVKQNFEPDCAIADLLDNLRN